MDSEAHQPPFKRYLLLQRFWRSASGYWTGPGAWRTWSLAAAMVATMLLQIVAQYWLNYWNRDFFDAIERRDATALWAETLIFAQLATLSVALAVFSVWGRMTMQRRWRAWLSNRLYDYWLGHRRHRKLRFMSGDHQAPEYRIAEDARVATDLPIDLVLGLVSSIITAATFIGVLLEVGGSLRIDAIGLAIPGYLVFATVGYSATITGATLLAGRNLVRVLEENKQAEADLRLTGSHWREKGEGTAMPDGVTDGRRQIALALGSVIQRWAALCWQLMRTTTVSHASTVLTPVVGLLLCVPKYLADSMTLGEVVQAAGAFVIVHGAFNWFTDNFARLAEWEASAHRVASLLLALDMIEGRD